MPQSERTHLLLLIEDLQDRKIRLATLPEASMERASEQWNIQEREREISKLRRRYEMDLAMPLEPARGERAREFLRVARGMGWSESQGQWAWEMARSMTPERAKEWIRLFDRSLELASKPRPEGGLGMKADEARRWAMRQAHDGARESAQNGLVRVPKPPRVPTVGDGWPPPSKTVPVAKVPAGPDLAAVKILYGVARRPEAEYGLGGTGMGEQEIWNWARQMTGSMDADRADEWARTFVLARQLSRKSARDGGLGMTNAESIAWSQKQAGKMSLVELSELFKRYRGRGGASAACVSRVAGFMEGSLPPPAR